MRIKYLLKIHLVLSYCLLFVMFFSCDNEPYEGGFPEDNLDACNLALQSSTEAALNFLNANADSYTQLCTAYKSALQIQIAICGDTDGSLQAIVDTLGNCIYDNLPDNCEMAIEAANLAESAFNNSSSETYIQLCNALKAALENVIDQCGDEDGSIQAQIDELGECMLNALEVEININFAETSIEFDMVSVVNTSDLLQVYGETSSENNYTVYFEIVSGQSGVNIINDSFVLNYNTSYVPYPEGDAPFYSEIDANTSEGMTGAFSGNIIDAFGTILFIETAVIDISF